MPQLTADNVEQVLSACAENLPLLSDQFSRCFDTQFTLTVGQSGTWTPTKVPAAFQQAGIAAVFEVDGLGAACLLPVVSLPNWTRAPNEDQRSRLDMLARMSALNLFPQESEITQTAALLVPNLTAFVDECLPDSQAATVQLNLAAGGEQRGSLLLVWPLTSPQFSATEPEESPATVQPATAPSRTTVDVRARLRHIPVPVSVRLAEKRIPVSQLLGITPGALITFNKSVEDLLDLYINNTMYCRGEAVKVGETFGLKINQIATPQQAESKVVHG